MDSVLGNSYSSEYSAVDAAFFCASLLGKSEDFKEKLEEKLCNYDRLLFCGMGNRSDSLRNFPGGGGLLGGCICSFDCVQPLYSDVLDGVAAS